MGSPTNINSSWHLLDPMMSRHHARCWEFRDEVAALTSFRELTVSWGGRHVNE